MESEYRSYTGMRWNCATLVVCQCHRCRAAWSFPSGTVQCTSAFQSVPVCSRPARATSTLTARVSHSALHSCRWYCILTALVLAHRVFDAHSNTPPRLGTGDGQSGCEECGGGPWPVWTRRTVTLCWVGSRRGRWSCPSTLVRRGDA